YVPNSQSATVDVIDPRRFKVVEHFAVGALPQHVTPAYDLRTLYVTNDLGNSLTPIDPQTGKPGTPIPVDDPYNMYFTPDGRYAIVVAERLHRLDFRFVHGFSLHRSLVVPCAGVDHMDFSADGRYASRNGKLLYATNRGEGSISVISFRTRKVVRKWWIPGGGSPDMGGVSADGKVLWVTGRYNGVVYAISTGTGRLLAKIPVGAGPHGLCVWPQPGRYSLGHTGILR